MPSERRISVAANPTVIESYVPGRMDRLPWARWHWLVVAALGITWILDGLEVTIVGAIAGALTEPESGLGLSESQIGLAAAIYIVGAVTGALFFSYLTDKYGRKKLFLITLAVYLVASVLTGLTWNFWTFAVCRFFTGAGIGGEYSAIYSAVDELVPAKHRGRVALLISGSFWVGTIMGSVLSIFLLNENIIPTFWGWRVAFLLGGVLGIAVLMIRRYVPESPRWLATHGKNEEADRTVDDIERQVQQSTGRELPPVRGNPMLLELESEPIGFAVLARAVVRMYPKRTALGLALMISQAFLYNAVFFTYALILTNFYDVPNQNVGYYIFPFAAGNILGPWLLGPLFDRIGRVQMISGCYFIAGALMLITGWLFTQGVLTATTQTALWCIVFFFASAAASAAYLTVSEIFPMEIRAMVIALFYAVGTGIGGTVGPILFGNLIESGDRGTLFYAYLIGAVAMIVGATFEVIFGVRAEGKSLEDIAAPLTAIKEAGGAQA
jgi:MFS family permease